MVSGLILTSLYILSLFFIWYKIVEGFPVDSDGKESACSVGGPDSTLGSGLNNLGSRREGNGNPLHYSCHGQRSLMGYSPWGYKESDMTEQLTQTHTV